MEYSIKYNQQFYTILYRRHGRKAFVFVWDFMHWLSFDASIPDIMVLGTVEDRQKAESLITDRLPGRQIVYKYCPKVFTWQ